MSEIKGLTLAMDGRKFESCYSINKKNAYNIQCSKRFVLPVYFGLPFFFEVIIGQREVVIANKTPVSG